MLIVELKERREREKYKEGEREYLATSFSSNEQIFVYNGRQRQC